MDRFSLRYAVERLRTGLFDAVAVNHLTVEQDRIENVFSKSLQALEQGTADPFCICGSYGQGKSHTLTYLNQLALAQGYATSIVQLDVREVPFNQFAIVYQSIAEKLSLPDGKALATAWKLANKKDFLQILDTIPHRFKMILTAMLYKTKPLPAKEMLLKKHKNYRPREYKDWLEQALIGYNIPTTYLKSICKYREIANYQDQSLLCRGNDQYFHMVQSLGLILKELGYKGLILFFDEAESIAQLRLNNRIKSYQLLDQFFQTQGYVLPIFAFTEDFFNKVNNESYDDDRAIFTKNYAQTWANLSILRLQDFSAQGWESLLDRLMKIYSQAYQIDLPLQIKANLQILLDKFKAQELRFRLKALINKLDIDTQHSFLDT